MPTLSDLAVEIHESIEYSEGYLLIEITPEPKKGGE